MRTPKLEKLIEPLVVLATVGLLSPAATGAACWLLLGRQRRSPAWGHPS